MQEINKNQDVFEKRMALIATLQSAIHQMDELTRNDDYTRYFKQRTENYHSFLSNFNEKFTTGINMNEGSQFSDTVAKIDRVAQNLKLSVQIELKN